MNKFQDLDQRTREVFNALVEQYLSSGDPVGSLHLSKELPHKISPATIRNILAKLEGQGFLGVKHISSGRLPTETGLRFFVDGILEMQTLKGEDQKSINQALNFDNPNDFHSQNVYERTGRLLSDLSRGASLVFTRKAQKRVKLIDIISLTKTEAMIIIVFDDGTVENRVMVVPPTITASDMNAAANFINSQNQQQTFTELRESLKTFIHEKQNDLDEQVKNLIDNNVLSIIYDDQSDGELLVRGRSHLISDASQEEDIENIRLLMDDLENKNGFLDFLNLVDDASAVRVFIGSENKLFSLRSSSLVLSPYMNGEGKVIGAVGVIGPTRLNYGRIIPMVSYTAQVIGRLIGEKNYE